ncbi:MAG: FHA domain-containing protein [Deltaproteobacteria bacterium]|nr:FHA domain-containing protein [Deltaproteobacteria bacterium]
MTLLGLELSDAGILAAGDNPSRLLEVDAQKQESPGVAVPEKKRLVVGNAAASKAHLFPLQVINRFWDQLNTEPLKQTHGHAQNHAEIACAHLSHIWENIKMYGDEVIIAVPDYYRREQLGLILGMARELSIPVNGFVSLPIAASFNPCPDAMLLHLDIHLHRFEMVYLRQDEQLTRENSMAVQEINLEQLYRGWVESIAEEFVRTTRFDPLHRAATEQELYSRLPAALEIFKSQPSFIFEIAHGKHRYRTSLLWDLLKQKSEAVYEDIRRSIVKMRDAHGKNSRLIALQLTHRIARLPGLKDKLSEIDHCEIMELEPGAGALGVLQIWDQLKDRNTGNGVSFFTSRPWRQTEPKVSQTIPYETPEKMRPTHLLYRDVAYPIFQNPLFIGCDPYPAGKGIYVPAQSSGVSKKHCTVHRDGDRIILTDTSNHGTFVNDQRVDGSTTLKLGQIVRLGTSGETFRLIACMETHET